MIPAQRFLNANRMLETKDMLALQIGPNGETDVLEINKNIPTPRPGLGQGQEGGVAQAQRPAEAEDSEENGADAADPAAAHVSRLRVAERFVEEFIGHGAS